MGYCLFDLCSGVVRRILDALLGCSANKADKQTLPLKFRSAVSGGGRHGSFYPEIAVEMVEGPLSQSQEGKHLWGPEYMDTDLQLASAVMAKAARRIAETVVG